MQDSSHLYTAGIGQVSLFITLNKSRKILRFFFLASILIFILITLFILNQ